MPVLTKHRFTTAEYYRMAETGVLAATARVELLDGEIIDMSPTGPSHGGVAKRLNYRFNQLAQGRWIVAVQDPVHLEDYSEPQPDMMLLKIAPDFYSHRHPVPADVYLLVEIADTSLEYDRERKLPAYGRAGICEFWIVNLENQAVEVYREPHLAGYGSTSIARAGDTVCPRAFPDAIVDVAELMTR
jgi:Uma2 family endonuclease